MKFIKDSYQNYLIWIGKGLATIFSHPLHVILPFLFFFDYISSETSKTNVYEIHFYLLVLFIFLIAFIRFGLFTGLTHLLTRGNAKIKDIVDEFSWNHIYILPGLFLFIFISGFNEIELNAFGFMLLPVMLIFLLIFGIGNFILNINSLINFYKKYSKNR